jgi:hypothetical protein
MRSPRNTSLFLHENVPAPISPPPRIQIGHPEKDLLHTFEQRRYSQEQMQCPQSTANWKITSRDTNSDLTFFYCCENDRNATIQGILYLLGGMCCIILLRL